MSFLASLPSLVPAVGSALGGLGGGTKVTQTSNQSQNLAFNPIITVSSPNSRVDPNNLIETRPVQKTAIQDVDDSRRAGSIPTLWGGDGGGLDPAPSPYTDGQLTMAGIGGDNNIWFLLLAVAGVILVFNMQK